MIGRSRESRFTAPLGGDESRHESRPLLRQVLGVVVANGLEFYDFVTYAFFAAQIGRAFFPSNTPGTSLLASLATFGAGFLTRPLGAWVIGAAKRVFFLYGEDAGGRVILREKLNRQRLLPFWPISP